MTFDADAFAGPVLVSAAYLLFWYWLLFVLQRGTKYRLQSQYAAAGKVFDRYFGQDEEMLAADRAVANTQEQMVPFFVSLWMCAIFATPRLATLLGAAYVVLRCVYPILLGRRVSKVQTKRVYLVTFPSYVVVLTLLGVTVWGVLR